MSARHDDLLEFYRRELAYLRTQGRDFAARHPKVARRLYLGEQESTDPHTERLIEAVAFLTARVHRDLDREFPQVAQAVLESVCPSLVRSVPSMTVAQMTLDPQQGKVSSGLRVARGTLLQALATSSEVCRFRVAWDTTLWPLEIASVQALDTRTLSLRVQALGGVDVSELELDELRLHLGGELLSTMPLHEMLLCNLEDIQIETSAGVRSLGADALHECGFDDEHDVLERPPHAHPAYGLLQEYFAFPRKFQFFDLRRLRGRLGQGSFFSIRLVFDRTSPLLQSLDATNFRLGCVPIINLFPLTSEPITLDRRRSEYLLVADRQRESSVGVHAVQALIASDPDAEQPVLIPHLYGSTLEEGPEDEDGVALAWSARHEPSLRPDIAGTDVFLSFLDRSQVRREPTEPVVYAQLLCTNRRLAEQVPPGARLLGTGLSESLRIRTLYEASAEQSAPTGSRLLTSLVSLLRLNHHSLTDPGGNLTQLQDLLMLFAGDQGREQSQVRGLRSVQAEPCTARVGRQTWRGHCQGTLVRLEFDEQAFAGGSPLLMAAVLARFLALYTTVNSFVQVEVMRQSEVWKRWPAMTGRQCLI